ncbi:MAG: methyltransferase domain-containing protein [Coriobacteriia bacterium]|nr:methyltransferase domain-containing protein [Coriobacteriia bacterium]
MRYPGNSVNSPSEETSGAAGLASDELSFAQLWRNRAPLRHKADEVETWNKRIAETPNNYGPSAYSLAFLELAKLDADDTVFDMGCGAGTLAIPCALAGHQVTAADFSDGMLAQLKANMPEHGVTESAIRPIKLSWEDDWQAADVARKSHDVAFASRSIITDDLEGSIKKLTNTARKKVCITVVPGCSPRCHAGMLQDIGLTPTGHQDASFAFAVAQELGLLPEVRYIASERCEAFATPEAAFVKYRAMLSLTRENPRGASLDAAESRMKEWLQCNLEQVPASSLDAKTRASIVPRSKESAGRNSCGSNSLPGSTQVARTSATSPAATNAPACAPRAAEPETLVAPTVSASTDANAEALVWIPKKKRMVTWAFLSWNAPDALL